MTYRTILTAADNFDTNPQAMDYAIELAQQNTAHLIGLFPIPLYRLPVYLGVPVPQAIFEDQLLAGREKALAARAVFEEKCQKAGISFEWRQVEEQEDLIADSLLTHARHSDLVIVGKSGADAPAVNLSMTEALMLESGRPVILVPGKNANVSTEAAAFGNVKKPAFAWNNSRESVRALHDAMPLIQKAGQLDVLIIRPEDEKDHFGDQPGADIATQLARQDIKIVIHCLSDEKGSVGSLLLKAAENFDSDLLIMGCYGHSRLRELIMGGATYDVMQAMNLPVLFSH